MGLATVREALLFSAKLRLPTSVSEQDREDWVDQVMMLVGLTKVTIIHWRMVSHDMILAECSVVDDGSSHLISCCPCVVQLANRLIGDSSAPSLSPGQLKLVTIAVEMVANPSILFLDEPTVSDHSPCITCNKPH